MKKLCYIIPSLDVGGSERQVTHLLRGLSSHYELMLVCTHRGGAFVGDARRAGAAVHVLAAKGGWDFRQRSSLRHIFQSRRPDVVHTFLSGFDLFANMAARAANVPVIISSRRELSIWMKRRHWMMQRLANKYVDCIVANSEAVAEFARRNEQPDAHPLRVIYNGIDAAAFVSKTDPGIIRTRFKIPHDRRIVGMVANFSPVKDHALFLDAAAELVRRRADVHFLLIGRGPLESKVRARAAELDVHPHCTFLDTVTELAELFAVMDVSVLCSRVEGCPNAVLESMAAGRPVVAANVGGIPELIRDGDTGFLVDRRAPAAFADAIECVLDHPEASAAVGARAAARVRREFSIERMLEHYRRLYTEWLEIKGV